MRKLEKFLTDLPRPDVDVSVFRDRLRRELLSARPARPQATGLRVALGITGALAAALAFAAVVFVARPAIPGAIHAAIAGPPALEPAEALRRIALPVAEDRAFVERWTEREGLPVSVRSVEDEQLFSVRRFELTDGKKMWVFTELGEQAQEPGPLRAAAVERIY